MFSFPSHLCILIKTDTDCSTLFSFSLSSFRYCWFLFPIDRAISLAIYICTHRQKEKSVFSCFVFIPSSGWIIEAKLTIKRKLFVYYFILFFFFFSFFLLSFSSCIRFQPQQTKRVYLSVFFFFFFLFFIRLYSCVYMICLFKK